MEPHLDLHKSPDTPTVSIPFRQLVGVFTLYCEAYLPEGDTDCGVFVFGPVLHLPFSLSFCVSPSYFIEFDTTKDKALTFRGGYGVIGDNGGTSAIITIFCDSGWDMGSVDRKSYSMNTIDVNGGLVAWYTHIQPVVGVSSTEAECIVVSDAYTDGLNTIYFVNEFVEVHLPIHMFTDTQGAM